MLKPYFNGKLGNQKSRNVDKGKGYLFKNSPSHTHTYTRVREPCHLWVKNMPIAPLQKYKSHQRSHPLAVGSKL